MNVISLKFKGNKTNRSCHILLGTYLETNISSIRENDICSDINKGDAAENFLVKIRNSNRYSVQN